MANKLDHLRMMREQQITPAVVSRPTVALDRQAPVIDRHDDRETGGTYQYRNADQRRSYMRDYMRKRRADRQQSS